MQHHVAPIYTRAVGSGTGYIWRSQCFTPHHRYIQDGAGDVIISSRDYKTAVATRKELTPTGHIRNSYYYNIWHPGNVCPTHVCLLRLCRPHCRLQLPWSSRTHWQQTEAKCQRNLLRYINTDEATLKTTCIASGWMAGQWWWLQGTCWARSRRKVSHHVTAFPLYPKYSTASSGNCTLLIL